MKNISIIIPTYFTTSVLFDCIESCKNMKGAVELVVVNNGNPIEDLMKLKALEKKGEIKLLDGHGNIGFARSCNYGASVATGKYMLFVNPDCYTNDKGFAIKLRDVLEAHPEYWFATSLILNSDGTIQKTCRRNLMTLSNALSQSLLLDRLGFEKINRDPNEIAALPDVSDLPAFSGALFFCTKEKYDLVGGLSEEYFLHVEDMDLCMKIKLAGGKICFVKNAIIYHKLSTSMVTSLFLEGHKAKGFVIYLRKFFSYANLPIIRDLISMAIWARYYVKTWSR